MDNRFRTIFLHQIQVILEQEPSDESLLKLLQLAKSDFSKDDLKSESARLSAIRTLNCLVHPDKHPVEYKKIATYLFQEVQSFFNRYCTPILTTTSMRELESGNDDKNKKKRKKAGYSPSTVQLPLQFQVTDQWPYLNVINPNTPSASDRGLIARSIAFKCINFRGAIVHGKSTELFYDSKQVTGLTQYKSVRDVFDSRGGTKVFSDTDSIKEEIMNHGPVVSTSFVLSQAFLNACDHSSSFAASQINQTHPLVIVGWRLSAAGEMWLARSIDGSTRDIPIAFGQFSIDDECLAPVNSFAQTPWQNTTKAFDVLIAPNAEWYSWPSIVFYVENKDLPALGKVLGGGGFVESSIGKTRLVLRDKNKIARSRWAYITEISLSNNEKHWKVAATFVA